MNNGRVLFRIPSPKRILALACAIAVVAACTTGNDQASPEPSVGTVSSQDGVTTSSATVPEPLTSFPVNPLPVEELVGLSEALARSWAEASGLLSVHVFASEDDVEATLEFDPRRLILVVVDGYVQFARIG